jgi:hypothetical protein
LRGVWFLRPSGPSTLMESRGGPRRIRARPVSASSPESGPGRREPRTIRATGPGHSGSDGPAGSAPAATSRRVSP